MDDRNASLGCGTLIVIALIVLLLGNAKSDEILEEVRAVRRELQVPAEAGEATELAREVAGLREEIRALREALNKR